jgi:hypothetical protein
MHAALLLGPSRHMRRAALYQPIYWAESSVLRDEETSQNFQTAETEERLEGDPDRPFKVGHDVELCSRCGLPSWPDPSVMFAFSVWLCGEARMALSAVFCHI